MEISLKSQKRSKEVISEGPSDGDGSTDQMADDAAWVKFKKGKNKNKKQKHRPVVGSDDRGGQVPGPSKGLGTPAPIALSNWYERGIFSSESEDEDL